GEALLLEGMDVAGGDMAAGRQIEVEGKELAAGLRAALANDNTLAADRIDDHASGALRFVARQRRPARWPVRRQVSHREGQLPCVDLIASPWWPPLPPSDSDNLPGWIALYGSMSIMTYREAWSAR